MAITDNQRIMLEGIARKYADVLSAKIKLREMYIFGSYATGKNDEESDIDIDVFMELEIF